MRGLSFFAGGELFAVDVTLVEKVIRNIPFTKIPAAPEAVLGIASIKGGIVTILSLTELLGRKKGPKASNAVIFKPFTNGNDQMGLLIEKPGGLIDIDDNEILPPPFLAYEGNKHCISSMAEVDGVLYRIINIDSIINRYKSSENAGETVT